MRKAFKVESELVAGSGGIFDVIVDGSKVFSKKEVGRFPIEGEIVNKLRK